LLPLLRQRFPQVDGALWRLSELAREQGEFLKALAKEWLKEWGQRRGEPPWETIAVPREAFLALPKALRRQVFRQMVEAMAGALNEVSFEHTEQALNLIARHSDQAMLHLPERLVVRLERGMILLAKMPSFTIGAS
jgi:hypothetical protein